MSAFGIVELYGGFAKQVTRNGKPVIYPSAQEAALAAVGIARAASANAAAGKPIPQKILITDPENPGHKPSAEDNDRMNQILQQQAKRDTGLLGSGKISIGFGLQ